MSTAAIFLRFASRISIPACSDGALSTEYVEESIAVKDSMIFASSAINNIPPMVSLCPFANLRFLVFKASDYQVTTARFAWRSHVRSEIGSTPLAIIL